METLIQAAQNLHWSESWATIFGIIYVILAARKSVWCWFWGIISCALWAYASFALYDLWLDALLQIFYVGMGFWGIYAWVYGGQNKAELPISVLSWNKHFILWGIGIVLAVLFGYFFDNYTPAAATYLDAFTTIFAIIATYLTVQKVLENWLYWVVVDLLYIYLYSRQEAFLFAFLMGLYVVIAIGGYLNWRRAYVQQENG